MQNNSMVAAAVLSRMLKSPKLEVVGSNNIVVGGFSAEICNDEFFIETERLYGDHAIVTSENHIIGIVQGLRDEGRNLLMAAKFAVRAIGSKVENNPGPTLEQFLLELDLIDGG